MLSSLESKYCNSKGKVKIYIYIYIRENVLALANAVANVLTLQLANEKRKGNGLILRFIAH